MITFAEYEKKKAALSELLSKTSEEVSLGKKTSNLFRARESSGKKIDVSAFNNVIAIDEKNMIADVEGMTTYEAFVNETLKFGLMPAVVPQLKTITIGGATTGIGIESSSFRYGFVHETVTEVEILLGTGKTIVCNKDQNTDLFFAFPNSYGTFGYALRLKVKLIPVKKFVKIEHTKYSDSVSYFRALEKVCAVGSTVDFVDGTIFSGTEMYITTGRNVDEASFTSDYTGMDIYYKSLKEKREDYLTIYDYIWRWDTDWFWCSMHFGVQNPLVRRIWGKKNLNSAVYWKIRNYVQKNKFIQLLSRGFAKREAVIQDIEVPVERAPEFAEFFHKEIGIKPVWVCPVRALDPTVTFALYPLDPKKLYVNFGFWDSVATDKPEGFYNRMIETKVRELQGKKSLYSDSFYSEQEFWAIYNKIEYDALKAKYDPNGRFKNLYQKTVLRK